MEPPTLDPLDLDTSPLSGMVGIVPMVSHPFKDTRGRFRTRSLFKEWETPTYPAYYNTGPEDEGSYISLRKRYLEIADPTEYTFARECLGGWDHHNAMLKACAWYRELMDDYREELDTKLKAEGIKYLRSAVADPKMRDAQKVAAAKYLAELGWKASPQPKRGRPSKDEVQGELKRQARAAEMLAEDADRLGIK